MIMGIFWKKFMILFVLFKFYMWLSLIDGVCYWYEFYYFVLGCVCMFFEMRNRNSYECYEL